MKALRLEPELQRRECVGGETLRMHTVWALRTCGPPLRTCARVCRYVRLIRRPLRTKPVWDCMHYNGCWQPCAVCLAVEEKHWEGKLAGEWRRGAPPGADPPHARWCCDVTETHNRRIHCHLAGRLKPLWCWTLTEKLNIVSWLHTYDKKTNKKNKKHEKFFQKMAPLRHPISAPRWWSQMTSSIMTRRHLWGFRSQGSEGKRRGWMRPVLKPRNDALSILWSVQTTPTEGQRAAWLLLAALTVPSLVCFRQIQSWMKAGQAAVLRWLPVVVKCWIWGYYITLWYQALFQVQSSTNLTGGWVSAL